jgi:thiamine biosynthesis protein ThiI
MDTLFLIKYGELALKGLNRPYFERLLGEDIRARLKGITHELILKWGRMYIRCNSSDAERVSNALSRTYGIVSFARAVQVPLDMKAVEEAAIDMGRSFLEEGRGKTFKVETRRLMKSFPLNSYEISSRLGQILIDNFSELRVDVHNPDWVLNVEVRESVYMYGPETKAPGGLPLGSSGKGLLLLSGGIDSPVAGYLIGRRGLKLDALHFYTPPFTSEMALKKAEKIACILSSYHPGLTLYTVPFTEVQLEIRNKAPEKLHTLLFRGCMMKVSDMIARDKGCNSLVTGESLGQVASQTVGSLHFTESLATLPVFRPLLGLNKDEIVSLARKIGTFSESILPYEDCCTLFTPEHPLTRPDVEKVRSSFELLNIEKLLEKAVVDMNSVSF